MSKKQPPFFDNGLYEVRRGPVREFPDHPKSGHVRGYIIRNKQTDIDEIGVRTLTSAMALAIAMQISFDKMTNPTTHEAPEVEQ